MRTENVMELKEFLCYENNLYYEKRQCTHLTRAKFYIFRSPKLRNYFVIYSINSDKNIQDLNYYRSRNDKFLFKNLLIV
jgi:hypothetical protein